MKLWQCEILALKKRLKRLEKQMPLTQGQIDTITAKVQEDDQHFLDFAATVTAEIAALKAGQAPDLTANNLQAAVDKLTADVSQPAP